MATVIWLHSAYGKRRAIFFEEEWLRGLKYNVYAPDLYEGRAFANLDDGFKHLARLGGEPGMLKRLGEYIKRERIGPAVWAGGR
jgi:hypothetical protein